MTTPKKPDFADAVEMRKREQRELGLFLSTRSGKKLIAELEKEFDGDDVFGSDDRTTNFNLGARHVVRLLKTLRDQAQKE